VWHGGGRGEPQLLASCYRRSLEVAAAAGAASIAFPCISTGVYGYPFEPAARIALASVRDALPSLPGLREVVFCCHSSRDLAVYERLLAEDVAARPA
jgi:O-acetyl-ADP-ribose deacetylase (regulator of RNase III)